MQFFFFNDTATTEIYTLSLHDALPIWPAPCQRPPAARGAPAGAAAARGDRARWVLGGGAALRGERQRDPQVGAARSEEHTSELQSRQYLVCRLLLEKKNNLNSTELHL